MKKFTFLNKSLLFGFCLCYLLLLGLSAHAVDDIQQWVSRFSGVENAIDTAASIATDANGNVYVTGVSTHFPTFDPTLVTIKYDSNGNPSTSWTDTGFGAGIRQYPHAEGTAIAVE